MNDAARKTAVTVRRPRDRQNERGYSLVETLIAMAILGSVLMGILSLFVMGRKNVYSGKQMTRAVAVSTRVMEDLSVLTRKDIQTGFALASTANPPVPVALSTVTVAGQSFPNSVLRVTTNPANPPDVLGYLGRWNGLLGQQNFTNGRVSMVITPIDPRAGSVVNTVNAPIYRVRVFVEWNEEGRRRFIALDTTKLDRTN